MKNASICWTALLLLCAHGAAVAQTATVRSAPVSAEITSAARLEGKLTKTLKLKSGATIEAGKEVVVRGVTGGTLESGTISGSLPAKADAYVSDKGGTATYAAVESVALAKAKLTNVKFAKILAKADNQSLDAQDDETASLEDASAIEVDLKDVKVAVAEINKPEVRMGATEAVDVPLAGDYFKFRVKVPGFKSVDAPEKPALTAPSFACFRVTADRVDHKDGKDEKIARGAFATPESKQWVEYLLPPYGCADQKAIAAEGLSIDGTYEIASAALVSERDRLRYGWTYGVLVLPFKYYLRDREFSAGATVGPYLGVRIRDRPGATQTFAIAIGATSASVQGTNGGSGSHTATGITAAVAYIGSIKGSFNYSVVFGHDYFSKSENVDPTRRKNWLGVAFGFDLR